MSAHLSVEDGEVPVKICFSDRRTGCRGERCIFVKNCGSYYIYELIPPQDCAMRYCGTDETRG